MTRFSNDQAIFGQFTAVFLFDRVFVVPLGDSACNVIFLFVLGPTCERFMSARLILGENDGFREPLTGL